MLLETVSFVTGNCDFIFTKFLEHNMHEKAFWIAVIWKMVGRRVAGHFAALEASVASVAQALTELKTAVQADFKVQAARLELVERRLDKLEGEKLSY